jgi:glycosyltransferase involved in cell wall biosynthesis
VTNLLIVERAGIGGSGSFLYTFLKHLDREKFYPVLALLHRIDTRPIKEIEKLGIEIVYLFPKYVGNSKDSLEETKNRAIGKKDNSSKFTKIFGYMRFIWEFTNKDIPKMLRFYNILNKRKIDLIVFNADVLFFQAEILAARIAKIPCVVRKAGVGYHKGQKLNRILCSFVDVFIASSKAEYRKHIQSGYPYKKMFTVYAGVDTKDFCPSKHNGKIRSEFGIRLEQKVVGLISRIDFGKGHFELIKAAKIVVDKIPDVVFLIVGDDINFTNSSLRLQIENEVKNLNLEKNFIFTGWRNDVIDILHTIDLFIHCPNECPEALGIATLEAMACGKPTIITNNDGLAETTIDNFNGFIVSKGDYNAIAQKLILLLNDNGLRDRMGANSRKRAEEEFDIQKNIRVFEQIMLENFKKND